MFKEKTKQGYEIVALIKGENGYGYNAVARKPDVMGMKQYVVCNIYNIYTGTWAFGSYVNNYAAAMKILMEKTFGEQTVFIVTYESDEDNREILGVFNSEEKAKEICRKSIEDHLKGNDDFDEDDYELDEYNHLYAVGRYGYWFEWTIQEEYVRW